MKKQSVVDSDCLVNMKDVCVFFVYTQTHKNSLSST